MSNIAELHPESSGDDSPIPAAMRSYSAWDMAGLWISMVISVPVYYMASSLMELGMSWWQGIATIVLANIILLVPLLLNAHAGVKYGISFPVQLRSAFGVYGAYVPAVLRSLVACGWCGIETWIGGQGIALLVPSSLKDGFWYAKTVPWLGTSVLEFSCFLLFMLLQLVIIWKGVSTIRVLESYSAPVLILLVASLFAWAYVSAGGIGDMLSMPSRLEPSEFWSVFVPSLTGCIGNWATVVLNISDFTRFSRSQKDQLVGQVGLPLYMGIYTFVGLAITSATQVIFGRVIANPIDLLAEINGSAIVTVIAILGISLATITTNIPANIVAPANALVSFRPSTFSFTSGAFVTVILSIAFQPWRIMGSGENYIYSWLVGYSAIIGPITGILMTDYYVLRRTVLDVEGLYSDSRFGPYYYFGGFNVSALFALFVSVVPTVPGFLYKAGMLKNISQGFAVIYDNSWFFGVFCSAFVYWILSYCSSKLCESLRLKSLHEPLYSSSA